MVNNVLLIVYIRQTYWKPGARRPFVVLSSNQSMKAPRANALYQLSARLEMRLLAPA